MMKNVSVALPESYLKLIKKLIDAEVLPSRSEAVRNAVREYLEKDIKLVNNMELIV